MAATTIGTNIVPDEQEFFKIMEAIGDFMEKKYLKNDENKIRMELMNKLKNHIKLGGKIAYNVIPAEFSGKVVERLEEQRIPYMAMPDGTGNYMVIVRDSDKDKFLDIQKNIEMLSTNYAKELTAQNMLELYRKNGIKDVDSLSFKSKDMAELAKQKLFQSGITFAEIENKEGTVELIVSPMSKYSKNGEDLAYFELHHAFEQSKADNMFKTDKTKPGSDFLDTRFKQAEYDKNQLETFAKNIKYGRNSVMCSLIGEQNICIEKNELGVFILEHEGSGPDSKWKSTPLDIKENASLKDITTVLSRYTEKIRDMGIVNEAVFDSIKDKKLASNDPLIPPSVPRRPTNSCISKQVGRLASISHNEIDSMIAAINREATKRVNASVGDKILSQDKLYEKKKVAIREIMVTKELPEITDFLDASSGALDKEERQEWYDNIFHHFDDVHENTEYSCDLNKTSVKDMTSQLHKSATMDKENETERDFD